MRGFRDTGDDRVLEITEGQLPGATEGGFVRHADIKMGEEPIDSLVRLGFASSLGEHVVKRRDGVAGQEGGDVSGAGATQHFPES